MRGTIGGFQRAVAGVLGGRGGLPPRKGGGSAGSAAAVKPKPKVPDPAPPKASEPKPTAEPPAPPAKSEKQPDTPRAAVEPTATAKLPAPAAAVEPTATAKKPGKVGDSLVENRSPFKERLDAYLRSRGLAEGEIDTRSFEEQLHDYKVKHGLADGQVTTRAFDEQLQEYKVKRGLADPTPAKSSGTSSQSQADTTFFKLLLEKYGASAALDGLSAGGSKTEIRLAAAIARIEELKAQLGESPKPAA